MIPDIAGDSVGLLWNLFDDVLHVDHNGKKLAPFYLDSGLIPLRSYQAINCPKADKRDERVERIRALVNRLKVPAAALADDDIRLLAPTLKY